MKNENRSWVRKSVVGVVALLVVVGVIGTAVVNKSKLDSSMEVDAFNPDNSMGDVVKPLITGDIDKAADTAYGEPDGDDDLETADDTIDGEKHTADGAVDLGDLSGLEVSEDEAHALEVAKLENALNPELLKDNKEYDMVKNDGFRFRGRKAKKPNTFRNGACIADSAHRVLAATYASNRFMTVNFCRSMCAGMKYGIAGVQYSSYCFCGNRFTRRITRTNRCRMRCTGNRRQICGGPWANNVYHTGGVLGGFGSKLIGCLQDRRRRVLNRRHVANARMSTGLCSRLCRGYRYFGVQYGAHCFCGNGFVGAVRRVKNCNMPCSGARSQVCGGAWAMNVYRRGGRKKQSSS